MVAHVTTNNAQKVFYGDKLHSDQWAALQGHYRKRGNR